MKKLVLIVWLVLFVASFGYGADYDVKGKAGAYSVDVKMDKNPPTKGQNNVVIAVQDSLLKPVTDAQVEVKYLMPSLPGRPPMMDYRATAKWQDNRYRAAVDLSMTGEWTVVITIEHRGRTERMQFTFFVK
jgi:hypothetical protein